MGASSEIAAPSAAAITQALFNPPTVSGQTLAKADLTFTSYVNPFDATKPPSPANSGARRNVGLADVTVQNYAALYRNRGRAVRFGGQFRANVSTLPLREAKVPTQIEHLAGFELQQVVGKTAQLIAGASGVWETDRDYKFQVAVGRFALTPLLNVLYQPRSIRGSASWLTAFHILPTVAYETGDVVNDRPERLIPNVSFQDRITRVRTSLNVHVEVYRAVSFSVKNDYFHMWKVARRPNRNYLDTALSIDPRPLFGARALGGLESAVVIKFQRGETTPAFRPVNVVSLGLTLTR